MFLPDLVKGSRLAFASLMKNPSLLLWTGKERHVLFQKTCEWVQIWILKSEEAYMNMKAAL